MRLQARGAAPALVVSGIDVDPVTEAFSSRTADAVARWIHRPTDTPWC